ncbi:MAG: antiterminator LoaP [Lachnospiraceae bacterium]|nr:antiterminator LoaP [Lachnospiraceae bacterium]
MSEKKTEKVYWYILFVKTGSEERIADQLKRILDMENHLPFVPRKTCVFRRQGKKSLFQKICFPGYVFIESIMPEKDFQTNTFSTIYRIKDTYRFLGYENKNDIAMRQDEITRIRSILNYDRCIDISTGYKEGDSVRIIEGSLVGQESKILRISKNKKDAIIALSIFGRIAEVSVGLDIIEKF